MKHVEPITVNVDEYLGLNKYTVDEGNPHIHLSDHVTLGEFSKLVRACPAALYKLDADGVTHFDYAGCLECGTCRVVGSGTTIASWRYPGTSMGVEYRYG